MDVKRLAVTNHEGAVVPVVLDVGVENIDGTLPTLATLFVEAKKGFLAEVPDEIVVEGLLLGIQAVQLRQSQFQVAVHRVAPLFVADT
ncbi:MAG: hypothetical protein ACYS7Y_24865 [Planctomycetota bacterium]|jgi:hypothetical protein